ncbi:MAG: TOBE domain-containing protein, partial [Solirubrobacteraceae bacterium]
GARCPVPVAGAGAFVATVEVVERAGHEHVWQLRAGAQRLAVRPSDGADAAVGDRVGVAVDPAAVRLFDPETGRAR